MIETRAESIVYKANRFDSRSRCGKNVEAQSQYKGPQDEESPVKHCPSYNRFLTDLWNPNLVTIVAKYIEETELCRTTFHVGIGALL